MSDESGEKKSFGGHLAVALAGIGALFARTADDCGRVAIKGAAVTDDALRGAGKVGSFADDGLRGGGKMGSLGDDALRTGKGFGDPTKNGLRAGAYGTMADDSLRGARGMPHGDSPVGLIEEASAGVKAESHAGDVAEFGVDVSLEVISNAPAGDDDDDSGGVISGESNAPQIDSVAPQKVEASTLLRARTRTSQPAFAPVLPTSNKAFQHILGRPGKTDDAQTFGMIKPFPAGTDVVTDPIRWLKGRLTHNPITFVFYSTDVTGLKQPIPLVLPNGGLTDDSAVHRACMEHYAHCLVLVCKPEKKGAKELCVKTVADQWQTVAADAGDASLSDFIEKLVQKRANTPALHEVAMSRVDLSAKNPYIVRSRLKAKKQ